MRAVFCVCLLTFLSYCTPKYKPPLDPFELRNATYIINSSIIEERIAEVQTAKIIEEKSNEDLATIKSASEQLTELALQDHIPSLSLMSLFQVTTYEGVTKSLRQPRLKKQVLSIIRKAYPNEKDLTKKLKKSYDLGLQGLLLAARYGYSPAIVHLAERKVELPLIDKEPRAVVAAKADYQTRLTAHNQRMANLSKAIVGGLVAGLSAYSAARYRNSNTANTFVPAGNGRVGLQGCCSWHNGVARDYYGKPMCTILGNVQCNDGWIESSCLCRDY